MYSGPAIVQLGTLLTVGIAIVSAALFLAWRDARQSGSPYQRRRRRRRRY
jgi:hypothetical protein